MTRNCFHTLAMSVIFSCLGVICAANPTESVKSKPQNLVQTVRVSTTAILDELTASGDFRQAMAKLDVLFDQVTAAATDKNFDAFRDAAFARRLVHQLSAAPADKQIELLHYLRKHDKLARTMAFMVEFPEPVRDTERRSQSIASPYTVLLQLREKFPDQLDAYANLTAAICVVHNRPFTRRVNENVTTAPPPVDLFEYYTTHEKHMLFGIKNVPPELLIYVVDSTASIEEMTWALKKYAGDQAIGRQYNAVAYDREHFRRGTPKKLTGHPYTLPNILKHGGLCADQAFFAISIGKSIGVPTAYTVGTSATVGHAWVGYLQNRGGEGVWNFDEGRYSAYRGVRGNVIDPQTRQVVPDSFVSLLAELIGTQAKRLSSDERHNAIALTDAAVRIGELAGGSFQPPPFEPKPFDARPILRVVGTDAALELLKAAVMQNKGYPRAWYAAWDMARSGRLNMTQKKEWRDAALSVCGKKYPDFALLMLEPIIASVEDANTQNQWWDVAFTMFQGRHDLCAAIRMYQAQLWENQKQPAKAGQCYEDVINRYTNAGPFVISALLGAEQLLQDKPDKALLLYEQTYAKVRKPRENAFLEQSNWFRIGQMYMTKLRESGKTREADVIAGQLGIK